MAEMTDMPDTITATGVTELSGKAGVTDVTAVAGTTDRTEAARLTELGPLDWL